MCMELSFHGTRVFSIGQRKTLIKWKDLNRSGSILSQIPFQYFIFKLILCFNSEAKVFKILRTYIHKSFLIYSNV